MKLIANDDDRSDCQPNQTKKIDSMKNASSNQSAAGLVEAKGEAPALLPPRTAAKVEITAAERHVALLALERGEGLGFLLEVSTKEKTHYSPRKGTRLTGCWVTTVVAEGAEAGLAASMGACC